MRVFCLVKSKTSFKIKEVFINRGKKVVFPEIGPNQIGNSRHW
jgi:hypothetical protein